MLAYRSIHRLYAAASLAAALSLSPLRAEEPCHVVLRAALSGEVVPDDDALGAIVLSQPAARREMLQVLAGIGAEGSSARRSERDQVLARLRAQLAPATQRIHRGLAEVDGRNPNAEHLIAAAFDIGAALGGPEDVPALVQLAQRWPREGDVTLVAAQPLALRGALSLLLARHPDAAASVRQRLREAPDELAGALVDALGDQESAAAARALAGALGMRTGFDGQVLNRLQAVTRAGTLRLHATELTPLRRFLAAQSAFERAQAALCLGNLDDQESIEHLIPLLRDSERSVVEAAHRSLGQLTALTIGPDHRRWERWYTEQQATWRERSAQVLARLRSSDRAEVLRALIDAAPLRLYRAALSEPLQEILESSDDAAVLVHAAAAVEGLRAVDALGAVVELLEDPRKDVRERALRTLRVLTGFELPARPELWRARLASSGAPRGAASQGR